jgi:geranylgeranyl pyrophosphate synthase
MQMFNDFVHIFNQYSDTILSGVADSNVKDAMRYALEAGGKRLRPYLVFAMSNQTLQNENMLNLAYALEMVHTYSLVHDDLPSMDNDDYRRGQLTTHKRFDEATAILAGDALLTQAFYVVSTLALKHEDLVRAIHILSTSSGANGMILGQVLDIQNDTSHTNQIEDLYKLYEYKTGCLFSAALRLGNLLNQKHENEEQLDKIGKKLGIVFQIQDDYLERTSTFDVIGKSNQSDLDNHKKTVIEFLGIDATKVKINELYAELNRDIMMLNETYPLLLDIVHWMKDRIK